MFDVVVDSRGDRDRSLKMLALLLDQASESEGDLTAYTAPAGFELALAKS